MTNNAVPFCGGSDDRNKEYNENYTPEKFYRPIIPSESPLILDVGAHHGESVEFFKAIFPSFDRILPRWVFAGVSVHFYRWNTFKK